MLLRSAFRTASLNISVKCSKAEHEANVPLGNGEVTEKLNNENNPTSTCCQQPLKHEFWLLFGNIYSQIKLLVYLRADD